MMSKKRALAILMACALASSLMLTGCSAEEEEEEEVVDTTATPESIAAAVAESNSVETSVLFEMDARIGSTGLSDSHTASIASDISVQSTKEPAAYHAEYYSNIMVDGITTREDQEFYVVPEENKHIRYEYDAKKDGWDKATLTQQEIAALPLKSGLVQDWQSLISNLKLEYENHEYEGHITDVFVGNAPASMIQELIGDKVFGSFLYSMEKLLNDEIPCTVYVDSDTSLPYQIILDFDDQFIVSDMTIENASITATYSYWNATSTISLPKKISIVASDSETEFYSTFYAWNLFLPYVGGGAQNNESTGNSGLSFTSSWDTFQMRIDNGMTSLPLPYEDLSKVGYTIDESYKNNIIEPNQYVENIPVMKGKDIVYCAFYNDDTVAQPITSCKIGAVDLSLTSNPQNTISIYLPGEISLGVSKEALLSAYGDPNQIVPSFACDTYTWTRNSDILGSTEGETNDGSVPASFLAEVRPSDGAVIRIKLTNIPVTGGKQ